MKAEAQRFAHPGRDHAVRVGGGRRDPGPPGRNRDEQLPLARASFFTLLVLAIPAWVVTLVFGEWAKSVMNWPDGLGWIDLGAGIANLGLFVLLVAAALNYMWTRRPTGGWPVTAWAR